MEEDIDTRFPIDGIHNANVIEWSKKRKPQTDQLDLHRAKHKCWNGNSSADEHARQFGENPMLGSMHIHLVDDSSEPESARDSNSFVEDSNTVMSINDEDKHEADSAKPYLCGRPSNIFGDWDGGEKSSSNEEDKFVDNECDPSYQYAELHALQNLKEQILGLGSHEDHTNSEYAKDSFEKSVDEEFEDILYSEGENRNMFVLSSGRWNVNQEAQSSKRPATIDQEFEQYFSMLML